MLLKAVQFKVRSEGWCEFTAAVFTRQSVSLLKNGTFAALSLRRALISVNVAVKVSIQFFFPF